MGKKKTNKVNLIICGIAFIIMLVVLFSEGVENIINALRQLNPLYLVIAVACMGGYWLGEAYGLHLAAKSLEPKTKFRTTLLVTMIGQYFNCITPFASGGQPMQVYTFVKRGMPLGSAMTALLSRFIVYQFTLTLYSIVFLVFRLSMFTEGDLKPLTILIIAGFIINTFVIALLFMLAFFRKATTKLAHVVVRLLGKLHIIKDVDDKIEYIDKELSTYYENFLFIKSRPVMILKMFLVTVAQLLFYFSITFIIYIGFGMSKTDFLTIIACQAFVLMISAFVPLPGAMGAAEGSYAAFFKGIFGDYYTGVSTFIWRFLTFYLPILIGIIINLRMSRSGVDLNSAEEKLKEPENSQ
ncbi:MAG: flippase-like domain-containing protein [Ruminiclostridium sp.]|nr:flippase-like domain-containing protein [Ruminiclostridium sp.]